jgi:hypothetical protein
MVGERLAIEGSGRLSGEMIDAVVQIVLIAEAGDSVAGEADERASVSNLPTPARATSSVLTWPYQVFR